MRAVVQRVSEASVTIDGQVHSSIQHGLMLLLGVEDADDQSDADWLCSKISLMRIFSDVDGKMNLSVKDIDGGILVVSQFTLHALTAKGNRPSFIKAARPEKAIPLYEYFIELLKQVSQCEVKTGVFEKCGLVF